MKKAFTLIELLVVIAIIAILAAILFPVFAQAKAAAKKTAALSNQKQINTSIQIYMADYDDYFPRNDGCEQYSSLNPDLNVAGAVVGDGCSGAGPFPYRMNHYAWQKWVRPYTKNIQLFEHPGRQKINSGAVPQWGKNGQIMGGMALNLAITGALNTFPNPNAIRAYRDSWKGGNQGSLPDVGRAMLLMEFSNPTINFAPVVTTTVDDTQNRQVVYPMAVKEFWASNFRKTDAACNDLGVNDESRVFAGVIVVGFADGSAKAIPVGKFLSDTPTAAEYGLTLPASIKCGVSSGTFFGNPVPNVNINYPFWGLSN